MLIQAYKYTEENLVAYANYLAGVQELDARNLKFLDEVHFKQDGNP
jgi:hypothetical protein